jgi:hypothetical protein
MSQRVEFEFPEFGFRGVAVAFDVASFDKYVDQTVRHADDAAHGVLARHVESPAFEEVEDARRRFPLLPHRLCDILCEVAGFVRDSAVFEEPLSAETPPGVLGMAGLTRDDAAKLLEQHAGQNMRIIVVRDADRRRLFSCVIRPDEEAARLIREERKNGKGFAKACRSAALAAMAWSSMRPEEAFEKWPAIPALCLADKVCEVAGANADRTFRRRQ